MPTYATPMAGMSCDEENSVVSLKLDPIKATSTIHASVQPAAPKTRIHGNTDPTCLQKWTHKLLCVPHSNTEVRNDLFKLQTISQ
jgi:hypothetical protein